MRKLILLTACFILLLGAAAQARDTHYQDFILGDRAMGMGGAYTALASDPTAGYYNPAGLAYIKGGISIAWSFYAYETSTISNGLPTGDPSKNTDMTSSKVMVTYPNANGFLKRYGAHAVGWSVLIPHDARRTYSAYFKVEQQCANPPCENDEYSSTISESDRSIWMGPSYAIKLSEKFSLGCTFYYVLRSYERGMTSYQKSATANNIVSYVDSMSYLSTFKDGALLFRLGAMVQPVKGFKIGLMLSAPTIKLHGSATSLTNFISSRFITGDPNNFLDADVIQRSGPSMFRLPFSGRLGVSYEKPRKYAFAADFSFHIGEEYNRFHAELLDNPDNPNTPVDPGLIRTIVRNFTWNINIGAEFYPHRNWPIRAGFFTNLSSAPTLDETGSISDQQPKIDYYGFSLSFGYLGKGTKLNFGVNVLFGSGRTVAGGNLSRSFVTDIKETLVYFYFAGAISAIKKGTISLVKKVKKLF